MLKQKEHETLEILDAIRIIIRIKEEEIENAKPEEKLGSGSRTYKRREESRQLRKRLGMDQDHLAVKAGVCPSTIVRYEQGLSVKSSTETKILQALNNYETENKRIN